MSLEVAAAERREAIARNERLDDYDEENWIDFGEVLVPTMVIVRSVAHRPAILFEPFFDQVRGPLGAREVCSVYWAGERVTLVDLVV